jgi:hypothetical protein
VTTSEFTVRYSEPLVRAAAHRFWLRALGWRFGLALLALAAFLAYQLAQGDRSWWVGLYGAIVGFGVIIAVTGWFAQRRRALQVFRDLEDGQAAFAMDDQRLKVSSKRGSAEIPWKLVAKYGATPIFGFSSSRRTASALCRSQACHPWRSQRSRKPCERQEGGLPNMALQRTRRPRIRSGRSLRSLGSPLNARPLGREQ